MKKWLDYLWDGWCILSVIGIWPRFIEPYLLSMNRLTLPIPNLPKELSGIKILQFSDLHWKNHFSDYFLKKITKKINDAQADFIIFTGDFLCRSALEDPNRLADFLNSLQAQFGYFAILGNHDYEKFVTINEKGDYDVELPSSVSDISKGFKRLFGKTVLSKHTTSEAKAIRLHSFLFDLLRKTSFQLLHNESILVEFKGKGLNICGLGEHTLGHLDPEQAFKMYQRSYPGIVLAHNPDSIPTLLKFPGELILCGHTHGGQVNLPGMWKKFTCMEHPEFKRGLKQHMSKWIYINRGVGSVMTFRWFSKPEITLITLKEG